MLLVFTVYFIPSRFLSPASSKNTDSSSHHTLRAHQTRKRAVGKPCFENNRTFICNLFTSCSGVRGTVLRDDVKKKVGFSDLINFLTNLLELMNSTVCYCV